MYAFFIVINITLQFTQGKLHEGKAEGRRGHEENLEHLGKKRCKKIPRLPHKSDMKLWVSNLLWALRWFGSSSNWLRSTPRSLPEAFITDCHAADCTQGFPSSVCKFMEKRKSGICPGVTGLNIYIFFPFFCFSLMSFFVLLWILTQVQSHLSSVLLMCCRSFGLDPQQCYQLFA